MLPNADRVNNIQFPPPQKWTRCSGWTLRVSLTSSSLREVFEQYIKIQSQRTQPNMLKRDVMTARIRCHIQRWRVWKTLPCNNPSLLCLVLWPVEPTLTPEEEFTKKDSASSRMCTHLRVSTQSSIQQLTLGKAVKWSWKVLLDWEGSDGRHKHRRVNVTVHNSIRALPPCPAWNPERPESVADHGTSIIQPE